MRRFNRTNYNRKQLDTNNSKRISQSAEDRKEGSVLYATNAEALAGLYGLVSIGKTDKMKTVHVILLREYDPIIPP